MSPPPCRKLAQTWIFRQSTGKKLDWILFYRPPAAATPAIVFPILVSLAQKHLRKLSIGQWIYLENKLQAIMAFLPDTYPTRLNLPQQGAFQLGYYHQTQLRFTAKHKEEPEYGSHHSEPV